MIRYACQADDEDHEVKIVHAAIEQHCRDCMNAINTRHLDVNTYPWTKVAPDFYMLNPTGDRRQAVSRADALHDLRLINEANPQHRIRIAEMTVNIRHKDGEKIAEAFMNAEVTGLPGLGEGVARKTVSKVEYRLIDGEWMAVSESTMDGMGAFIHPLGE
ncbi:uncharacterized protein MYCFIDRAFT_200689 [Pseudocercospora fijiensis CIRAD86]|uniref:SnoaL-like domain-containing protein n=1 Tax=Pseudocercospora fijiensis (strain CIRAD86) TaxID=383855 RepID=M2ZZ44_PSEFD|nr:uncharacterized protein MYCFIDRAFT_200689 [Pseudocercospora fijiensis CIRAD86]EME77421.1 hypothetical protein MYCFIDRAFT_200689 [Pseudocercospora fijiensis CIRAD86]